MRLELNADGFADPWKHEYSKRFPTTKDKARVKNDKRRIRHAEIDETNNKLYNAIAEYKGDNEARDWHY
jgi:hypothetical protein